MWRLWMSQSCFSLGFLSQNSLWKLSQNCGCKGIYIVGWEGMWKVSFFQTWCSGDLTSRLGWVVSSSREFKQRANGLASLGLLSCSATAGATLQLLACLACVQHSSCLQAASHQRDPATSPYFFAQSWAILHTLSHTIFTWFPPKYRVTNY